MIPVAKVKKAFDELIQTHGSDCAFVLRTGEAFTIKGVLRFTPEINLTEGLQQDGRKLSVMGDRWEQSAPTGRNPEKGDQVTINGQRFAIEEADPATIDNECLGWRIKLRG